MSVPLLSGFVPFSPLIRPISRVGTRRRPSVCTVTNFVTLCPWSSLRLRRRRLCLFLFFLLNLVRVLIVVTRVRTDRERTPG